MSNVSNRDKYPSADLDAFHYWSRHSGLPTPERNSETAHRLLHWYETRSILRLEQKLETVADRGSRSAADARRLLHLAAHESNRDSYQSYRDSNRTGCERDLKFIRDTAESLIVQANKSTKPFDEYDTKSLAGAVTDIEKWVRGKTPEHRTARKSRSMRAIVAATRSSAERLHSHRSNK